MNKYLIFIKRLFSKFQLIFNKKQICSSTNALFKHFIFI